MLALTLVAACATGRAISRGDQAAASGDWDAAVASYREAIGHEPGRADLKIKLDRASRQASAAHMRRARDLEADQQMAGALAEYRLAAELDPTNLAAAARAAELDRQMREQAEAARSRPRIETLRDQNAQTTTIPRLDPRTVVPELNFPNASVRDLLTTISQLTNISIQFDSGLDAQLSRPHPLVMQETPLEEVLNQILQASQLTFKVLNARTIFVYQDTQQKRLQFEDVYLQHFYLSQADPQQMQQQLTGMFQGMTGLAIPPRFSVNAAASMLTVRATAPVLQVIESYIRANDRALPEVLIEAEILEVDRNYLRQLGIDLNQWALGFTFSPALSPAGTAAAFPQGSPPPFPLNTLSNGVSSSDFYLTSPTAVIRLLESNINTKLLARPSARGTAGKAITLTLGDQVPIPTTVFQAAAPGGVNNIPATSVNYVSVGVNLLFTPKVTYDDYIVLEGFSLEKSGLGASIDVGGQSFPTIVSRKTQSVIRLRDGESTMISGLLLDDERRTIRSLPGLTNVPVLRSIFGGSERQIDQTDIVMVITPRIVSGHNLRSEDLRPMYIGTGQNISTGPAPLISPEALDAAPQGGAGVTTSPAGMSITGGPGAQTPAGVGPGGLTTSIASSPATSPAASRAVELEPITPRAPSAAAPAAPRPAPSLARLVVTAPPGTGTNGALTPGTGPHAIPIQISDATDVVSATLTILYDATVVRMPTVTQGSFLAQGGVSPSITPALSPAGGRIEVSLTRPAQRPGASGSGVLAAVSFLAGGPGETDVIVTGVATTSSGQTIPLQATPARIVVR